MREFFVEVKDQRQLFGAEIGVWQSKNASEIFKELDMYYLALIDPWKAYDNKEVIPIERNFGLTNQHIMDWWYKYALWKFNTADNVTVIRKHSYEIVGAYQDNFFDFVYIDGRHIYKDVLIDCEMWYPKVRSGGILGGHDYYNELCGEDIRKAVNVFLNNKPNKLHTRGEDWWIRI